MVDRYNKLKYSKTDYERYPNNDETRRRGEARPPFEVDRSRVIHSSSFRRMQGKTQVFSPGEGDFYRNRLTHSLEVAQIGKGLALRLGADPDLVETICLAHDIGHPPFGHSGEEALASVMRKRGGFEANAQNIRIVVCLEERREDYVGLNLTRAALDGLLKYKAKYEKDNPGLAKFYYDEESSKQAVEWALADEQYSSENQSFECQIMSWADDIAYAVHDFEDALHGGFVELSTMGDQDLLSLVKGDVLKEVAKKQPSSNAKLINDQWTMLGNKMTYYLSLGPPTSQKGKGAMKHLTSDLINYLIQNVNRAELSGRHSDRYRYELQVPDEVLVCQLLLNKFIERKVMRSYNVQSLEAKGRMMLRALFRSIMRDPERLLPDDWRFRIGACKDDDEKARIVCDYVSGMTDAFAGRMYARLFIPGAGSVYEPI